MTSHHKDLTSQHKDLTRLHTDRTRQHSYLTSDGRNMPPKNDINLRYLATSCDDIFLTSQHNDLTSRHE